MIKTEKSLLNEYLCNNTAVYQSKKFTFVYSLNNIYWSIEKKIFLGLFVGINVKKIQFYKGKLFFCIYYYVLQSKMCNGQFTKVNKMEIRTWLNA